MPRTAKNVNGAQIISDLENIFAKYVVLDSGLPLVLALWTVATHLFECFDAFPYLAITSPTKRCGKTRLAEVIELFCVNGLRTVGATPAAIFRSIQMSKLNEETLTLIMDEAEVLRTKSELSEALREILNAGYRQGQYILRCERPTEGGLYEPKQFSVYCPKVIVLIGNLNDTLADRCIPVTMRRRKLGEHVERFFPSQAEKETRRLRKDAANWAKASLRSVKRNHRQKNVEFLEDREAELWAPLFATCATAAPERLEQLKSIALRVSRAKQADEPADMGILVLKDIRMVFDRNPMDRVATVGLLDELKNIEESPWQTWGRGYGLDARALARLLKPFKVEPHNLRLETDQVAKGYTREDFAEAWATYLPADASTEPLQVGEDGGVADPERLRSGDPEGQTANNGAVCSAVAGQDAPVDPNDPRLLVPLKVNLNGDAYVFDMKRRRRRRG